MAYVCGLYDKKAQAITSLTLVVLVTEELQDDYAEGKVFIVGKRRYILTARRFVAAGVVVQYDLVVQKGT